MCSDVNRVCLKALQRPKQGIDLGFLCVPVSDEANDGAVVIGYGFFIGAIWALFKMCLSGIFWQRISYFIAYFRRLFLTKEKTPYYLAKRDGDEVVIPFAMCLFGGFLLFLI